MDERLEKALDFSNYMVTLKNQKRILRKQFEESIICYYKGSQFTADKSLINFLSFLLEKNRPEPTILVDDNKIPVLIDDITAFLDTVLETYFSATNTYHDEYQKLLRNRSTMKLVEYEQE